MLAALPEPDIQRPRPSGVFRQLRRLYSRRETIRFLTLSELKAGHRDKVLGHLWSILDPLLFMLVYYFVFGILFRSVIGRTRPVDFMLYILIGILLFRFISMTITTASTCLRSNRGIIHEVNFPKSVFPVAITLSRLYDFLWGFSVLIVFLLASSIWPTIQYLWVPVLVLLMLIFAMGGAFVVAVLGALFADTGNVVGVLMRLLFYCSPVFYFVRERGGHTSQIGSEVIQFWYLKNPVACFMETFRDVLLWGRPPQADLVIYAAVFSIVLWFAGFWVFSMSEGRFAKYV